MLNQKRAALVFDQAFLKPDLAALDCRKDLLQFGQSVLEILGRRLCLLCHRCEQYKQRLSPGRVMIANCRMPIAEWEMPKCNHEQGYFNRHSAIGIRQYPH